MPKFISQTNISLKKKKKRWTPKGRQSDQISLQEVKNVIGKKSYSRFLLIEYLHLIQDKYGLLRDKHLVALAELINIPLAEVYEVSTFYAHFNVVKDSNFIAPEVTIRVCESLTCEMFGSKRIFDELKLTKNKSFRVLKGPCMGRCQHAPTVCVGKNYIDNADSKKVLQTINKKDF